MSTTDPLLRPHRHAAHGFRTDELEHRRDDLSGARFMAVVILAAAAIVAVGAVAVLLAFL